MTELPDSIRAGSRTWLDELRALVRECERLQALPDGSPTKRDPGGQRRRCAASFTVAGISVRTLLQ
jgi:hypothetical protein